MLTAPPLAQPTQLADARIVQDIEGVLLSVETTGDRLYGWPIEDLIGARAPMLVHPDDREIVIRVRQRVRTTGVPQRVQIRVRTFGGRWLWAECSYTVVPDARGGEAQATVVELRDVSARYLRDEALQLLVDVRSLIDGTESLDDALRAALGRIAQWGGFDAAAYWHRVEATWRRRLTVSDGSFDPAAADRLSSGASTPIAVIESVATTHAWAWADDPTSTSTSTSTSASRSFHTGCGIRTLLVPVVSASTTIGVIELVGTDTATAEGSVELVFEVAKQLGDTLRRRQAEAELDLARQRFAIAFDAAPIGMALVAPDGSFIDVNSAMCRLLDRGRDELLAVGFGSVTHPDDLAVGQDAVRQLLGGEIATYQTEKRYLRPDGSIVWGHLSTSLVRDDHGRPVHFVSQIQDISERKSAEAEIERTVDELAANERRYRSLIEPSFDIIARIGVDGRITDLNDRAAGALGTTQLEVAGRHVRELVPAALAETVLDHVSLVASTGRPDEIWRTWLEPADRAPGWFVIRLVPEPPSEDSGYVEHVHLMASDITELVENEQRLSELALVDPLTGLSNRAAVHDRLQHALDRLDRHPGTGIAVAMVDLDDFKAINDEFGHVTGDAAICAAATALQRAVRTADTVGRVGGDEFVVVVEDVADERAADLVAGRLRDELAHTLLPVGNSSLRISGSVGVTFTDTATSLHDLVARADRAMYDAKRIRRRTPVRPTPDAVPEEISTAPGNNDGPRLTGGARSFSS